VTTEHNHRTRGPRLHQHRAPLLGLSPVDAPPLADPTGVGTPAGARGARSRVSTMGAFQAIADVVAILVVSAIAWWSLPVTGTISVVTVLVLAGQRMYRTHLTPSVLDQIPGILAAGLGGGVIGMIVSELIAPEESTGAVLIRAMWLILGLVITRTVAMSAVRNVRRRGLVSHRTLVLGSGEIGSDLLRRFRDHRELGLLPVGVLDPDPMYSGPDLDVPYFGGFDRLSDVIQSEDVDVVVVAFSGVREAELVDVLRTCDRLDCDFLFVPRLFELQHVHGDMEQAWGMPLVRVRRAAFRTVGWRIKRAFDFLSASLLLLAISPVMAAVALAVRLEGGPGIIFSQTRVGLDGRPFTMLKFRSLRPVDDLESQTKWNVSNDHRMGPVGKIIRATSLDELPQLINVIRGDMSVVGPRPERPHFVEQFSSRIPRYTGRHRVPAGLTGLAAVHGLRGDTSITDRTMLDNYYIENWSLWLDAKVLCMTVASLVRHPGS
jgi:exopolysaccharide biosynthesis polyprenyl glycosylphosphotransferase